MTMCYTRQSYREGVCADFHASSASSACQIGARSVSDRCQTGVRPVSDGSGWGFGLVHPHHCPNQAVPRGSPLDTYASYAWGGIGYAYVYRVARPWTHMPVMHTHPSRECPMGHRGSPALTHMIIYHTHIWSYIIPSCALWAIVAPLP